MKALTGAHAVAEAMRQINPDVVPAYPITPQTEIAQKFADFVADGIVDSEMIRVESEHSAMSAAVGASAAGARTMTATSSAGLALMWEILGVASGLRLPIVMSIVNRALSAPINIHGDHSDSMGCRDHSWIQIYSENAQEVYENTLLAVKLAEDVLLPAMVMQDGFIVSHGLEDVKTLDDKKVKAFVGEYKAKNSLLDVKKPVTVGPLQLQDYYFETKRQQDIAMDKAKKAYLKVGSLLSKLTGNKYGYFEEYNMKNAKAVIVTMSSAAGTTKAVIDMSETKKVSEHAQKSSIFDKLQNKKIGLLKIKLFRPFPYKEVANALKNAKAIAVLDRSESYGANAPLFSEIKNSLYDLKKRPKLHSCIFGLGGRNLYEEEIIAVFKKLLSNKLKEKEYIGVR